MRKHLSSVGNAPPPEPHISVIEAARILGISKTRYYAGMKAGQLPGRIVGDHVLILRRWLTRFIETGRWGDGEQDIAITPTPNPFLHRLDRTG